LIEVKRPFILYGQGTDAALDAIEEQCEFLVKLRQLALPPFVARKLDHDLGYLLVRDSELEGLQRLIR